MDGFLTQKASPWLLEQTAQGYREALESGRIPTPAEKNLRSAMALGERINPPSAVAIHMGGTGRMEWDRPLDPRPKHSQVTVRESSRLYVGDRAFETVKITKGGAA